MNIEFSEFPDKSAPLPEMEPDLNRREEFEAQHEVEGYSVIMVWEI